MRANAWVAWLGCVALLLAGVGLAGCKARNAGTRTPTAAQAWAALLDEWIESDLKANPTGAAYHGRHEYDGLFPDWSEAGLRAEIRRLKQWQARVQAVDTQELAAAAKFQRQQLLALLDGELFWREAADWPHRNPSWYYLDPSTYLDRPYADLPTRMKAYMRWASNLPRAAAQIKANLKGPLPRPFIDIGMHTFGPLGDFLKQDVAKVFAGTGDAGMQAEFTRVNTKAVKALADLQKHLQGLRATQTEDFAMGRELFAAMLKATEMVDTPLEELEATGRADLQRNQAALAAECKVFAPGQTIAQCVAKVGSAKPEGGNVVAYAGRQLAELQQFVRQHDIVSIPGSEEAKVKQSPPYNAQNSAYIDIPGPYENEHAVVLQRDGAGSVLAASQAARLHSRQGGSAVHLGTRSVARTLPAVPAFQPRPVDVQPAVRGLCLRGRLGALCEELMWEEGLGNGDPEVHIGQLTNATLRNVRLLSAIGLHTGGMTLEESRRMFIDEGHQDEGNAEQQAARGAYDPAYLNYTMGKLMIRRLRSDWCGARGGADNPPLLA